MINLFKMYGQTGVKWRKEAICEISRRFGKWKELIFTDPSPFLWEKTEVENPPYWKPSPSPAALIPKEERKTTAFPPGIRILSFAMPSEYPVDLTGRGGAIYEGLNLQAAREEDCIVYGAMEDEVTGQKGNRISNLQEKSSYPYRIGGLFRCAKHVIKFYSAFFLLR